MLHDNVMSSTDPLALTAGAAARLWRAGLLLAALWALVIWALA